MWNPIKIEIDNLFAHRHSEYAFKNGVCTVVCGENLFDRGLQNNGAGKTTIFEAICIALTNESLRNIKKESFINHDAEECRIMFQLNNPALRMDLSIERRFYRGNKSAKVEVCENGVVNRQVVSVAEANKRILELIGISREDLLRYFIISQDNTFTFFTASDVEKKEVMNRITSADVILPLIDKLSKQIQDKKAEIQGLENSVDKYDVQLGTLERQREELLNKRDNAERIESINKKIKDTTESIETLNEEIAQLNKNKAIAQSRHKALMEAVSGNDLDSLRVKHKGVRGRIQSLEKELAELQSVKRNLKLELSDAIKCPECGAEFIPNSQLELSPDDAREALKETEKQIKVQQDGITKANKELSDLSDKITKLEAKQEEVEESTRKLNRLKRTIDSKQEEVTTFEERIKQYKQQIKDLKDNNTHADLIKSLDKRISDCKKEKKAITDTAKVKNQELDDLQFWHFNLGKTGFMTYLANKSVKIIEGITNSYLLKFGVDISVVINGFKVLKSGEVREKIDVFVSSDGLTTEAFMAKSGGERGRITLAGILGIQHLINLSTNGRGLNLLILDEVLSGIDSGGTMEIIDTLNKLGGTVMMITQNIEDVSICQNVLRIVKNKEGISEIK